MHAIKLLQIARYIMFYTHIALKKEIMLPTRKRCFKTVILGRKKSGRKLYIDCITRVRHA